MARSGLLLVDKSGGMTSHDVVARARRALGTRRVGHAGTLDPMATGLLVLGVEAATRLLTFVVGADKTYTATILLGVATDTDDADGEPVSHADPATLAAVADADVTAAVRALTGDISQVPSRYSAIKVRGRRAYDLARAGEAVELESRRVVVSRFEVTGIRREARGIAVDAEVDCSSGTYVRALARDLGEALGVGGHLTALRRTRVGPFDVAAAASVDDIGDAALIDPATAASLTIGSIRVSAEEARDLRHGKRLVGAAGRLHGPRAAAIAADGALVGVVERRGDDLKSAMNMPEETAP